MSVVISVVSALAAIAAAVITWLQRKRPFIVIEWQHHAPFVNEGVPEWPVLIRNVGDGMATDVRLSIDIARDATAGQWWDFDTLEPGERQPEQIVGARCSLQPRREGRYTPVLEPGGVKDVWARPTLTVSYRQPPFFWWVRKKSSTLPDSPMWETLRDA